MERERWNDNTNRIALYAGPNFAVVVHRRRKCIDSMNMYFHVAIQPPPLWQFNLPWPNWTLFAKGAQQQLKGRHFVRNCPRNPDPPLNTNSRRYTNTRIVYSCRTETTGETIERISIPRELPDRVSTAASWDARWHPQIMPRLVRTCKESIHALTKEIKGLPCVSTTHKCTGLHVTRMGTRAESGDIYTDRPQNGKTVEGREFKIFLLVNH